MACSARSIPSTQLRSPKRSALAESLGEVRNGEDHVLRISREDVGAGEDVREELAEIVDGRVPDRRWARSDPARPARRLRRRVDDDLGERSRVRFRSGRRVVRASKAMRRTAPLGSSVMPTEIVVLRSRSAADLAALGQPQRAGRRRDMPTRAAAEPRRGSVLASVTRQGPGPDPSGDDR